MSEWKGPKPKIVLTDKGGWFSYDIIWNGKRVWSGDATRHGAALSAGKRNRKWIMEAILRKDKRFVDNESVNANNSR